MKKKTIANLIMIAVIVVIAAAGVLSVGALQGWFDKADDTVAVLAQIRGIVNLERGGAVFPVENDTVLRSGDKITTIPGASAVIVLGDDTVTLGGSAELTVNNPGAGGLVLHISTGEVFVNSENPVGLSFELGKVMIEKATASLSVRAGAQTVSVFRGAVGTVQAGRTIEYVGGEVTEGAMQLESLNDFLVAQIRKANASLTLCYSNRDLDDLAAKRQQAIEDMLGSQTTPTEHTHSYSVNVVVPSCTAGGYTEHFCQCGERYTDEETAASGHSWEQWAVTREPTTEKEGLRQRKCQNCEAIEEATIEKVVETHTHDYAAETIAPTCTTDGYTLYTCACGHSYTDHTVRATGHSYHTEVIAPTCENQGHTVHKCACGDLFTDSVTPAAGHKWGGWKTVKESTEAAEGLQERACDVCGKTEQAPLPVKVPEAAGYVYLSIRCDTILDNMDALNPGKVEFVPADGIILPATEVAFYEGETVFDVLKRTCGQLGIQLEYSWSPFYDSYYIESINNLYERDCGSESGWTYLVNDWAPNYGCSAYALEDGDAVLWAYTCQGLGSDIG